MWIMLNNSFLSIVSPTPVSPTLNVRARAKGDIEKVFPKAKVVCLAGRDYAFRASIPRHDVAAAIANQVTAITYPNFKDSVKQQDRKGLYSRVWGVMADLQRMRGHGGPYETTATGKARRGKRGQASLPFTGGAPYGYERDDLPGMTGDPIIDAGGDIYDFMAAEERGAGGFLDGDDDDLDYSGPNHRKSR